MENRTKVTTDDRARASFLHRFGDFFRAPGACRAPLRRGAAGGAQRCRSSRRRGRAFPGKSTRRAQTAVRAARRLRRRSGLHGGERLSAGRVTPARDGRLRSPPPPLLLLLLQCVCRRPQTSPWRCDRVPLAQARRRPSSVRLGPVLPPRPSAPRRGWPAPSQGLIPSPCFTE